MREPGGYMSPVTNKELTPEQKQQDQNDRDTAHENLKSELLNSEFMNSLELPADTQTTKKEEAKTSKAPEQEESETDEEETTKDDEQEENENEESSAEDKEDLAAENQKLKRANEKLQRRLKNITRDKYRAPDRSETRESAKDSDEEKLEAMGLKELKETRRNVRLAARNEKDDATYKKLLELEDKIDDAINSYDSRFLRRQNSHFQSKAEDIVEDLLDMDDVPDKTKAQQQILQYAKAIYNRAPELKKSEHGQARALEMGFDYFKDTYKLRAGNKGNQELKRKLNTLKKKTSLDATNLKGVAPKKLDKLREKAFRGGTIYDKEELVKHDPAFGVDQLIPEEFKGA